MIPLSQRRPNFPERGQGGFALFLQGAKPVPQLDDLPVFLGVHGSSLR
jgi:hypothetical protein